MIGAEPLKVFGAVINNGAGGIRDGSAMFVEGDRAVQVVCECGDALQGMMKLSIVENADREHMVAESHVGGGDGGDGGAIWENNIYGEVWGRGEKRCRDIRKAKEVITGA